MTHHYREIPGFVYEHMDNMKAEAESMGYSVKKISSLAGVPYPSLINQVNGYLLPTKNCYNKVAQIFNWEVWE